MGGFQSKPKHWPISPFALRFKMKGSTPAKAVRRTALCRCAQQHCASPCKREAETRCIHSKKHPVCLMADRVLSLFRSDY